MSIISLFAAALSEFHCLFDCRDGFHQKCQETDIINCTCRGKKQFKHIEAKSNSNNIEAKSNSNI